MEKRGHILIIAFGIVLLILFLNQNNIEITGRQVTDTCGSNNAEATICKGSKVCACVSILTLFPPWSMYYLAPTYSHGTYTCPSNCHLATAGFGGHDDRCKIASDIAKSKLKKCNAGCVSGVDFVTTNVFPNPNPAHNAGDCCKAKARRYCAPWTHPGPI